MTPASNVDAAFVYVDEGVSIPADLYQSLQEIRVEAARRKSLDLPPLPVKEKARQAGVRVDTFNYLFPLVEKQAKQFEEMQRRRELRDPHDFEDRMPRSPQEKTRLAAYRIPDDSPSGSRIDWDSVPGYVDTREEAAEFIEQERREERERAERKARILEMSVGMMSPAPA